MAHNQNHVSGNILKDTLSNAVGNIVSNMQPQVNEFATRVATRAVDRTGDFAALAYRRVQSQPWYLVGFAAILLIGAAIMLGFSSDSHKVNARTMHV